MSNHDSAISLLAALKDIGCRVWVEDGELRVRAPKAGITEELKKRLKANREKILAHLDSLQAQDTRLADGIPVLPPGSSPVMSHAQQRLWFLAQLEGPSATYNMPDALKLSGPLDVTILRRTFRVLIERHQTLRLCFPTVDGEGMVREIPNYDPLTVTDLGHLPETQQQTEIQQRLQDHMTRPFDLAEGKLLRFHLLILNDHEHVLLFSMHHIISDGWSMGVLVREWGEIYSALLEGRTPDLDPLPIQYSDYAAWQRDRLQGEVLQRQLSYWTEQLADVPELLALPTDFPRPARQSYRGNHLQTRIDSALTKHLNEFAQQQSSTPFMVLLAAFDVLLARYSGQNDICVGSPIANRTHPDTENLIGLFVNTLVLRTRLNPEQGFRALVQQVRQTCIDAYAHQDIPFETLVEQLNPTRSTSHNPLFQVMLALENNDPVEMELPGLTITDLAQDYPITQFDLILFVGEQDGQLHCTWRYATSLFTIDTIRRMGEHFEVLLRAIVEDPERPVSQLPLLTETERQRILVEWNDTAGPVSPALLHDLFVWEAQRRPGAPAIIAAGIDLGRTLTYGELLDLARRTAHWLQRNGIASNTLVAVVMEKGWEQVVAVLGILMAGGAYLPIDAHLPAARRNDLMTDGEARLALTQPKFSDLEWPEGTRLLIISETTLAPEEASVAESTTGPEDLAYVIYTSGSTGRPKGVMIDHRGAVNTILDINRRFSVTEEDRVLCLSALNFDLSVYDVFGVLAAGGVLVIPEEEGLRDPAHWRALMLEHGITLWDTVPALKQMLVEYLESRAEPVPPGMRLVMMSGDWIPLDLPGRIRALWPEVEVIGLGGATEASIWSNFHPIEDVDPDWNSIPYGKPLTNQFFRVLDSHLEPRPVRLPGDLYIGGIGLAKGYWNDPAKTAERFIVHPVTHERLYRTGDLGRYLPDGNLEFLGRSDFQVKIRGHRIELGEIEAVLTSHPAIKEAVVVAVGAERDLQALAAYVVLAEPGQSSDGIAEELKAHVDAGLPGYMVPATFTILDAIPLTSSGKVDRKALPDPDSAIDGDNYEPPRNANEQQLADIWSALLKRPDIGIHDNFFDLGGDSILSIQIVSRARQAGLSLNPRDVFEYQTIAELAGIIQLNGQVSAEQGLVQGDVPLTPIQSWFFDTDSTEPWYFNQAMLLEVPFDVEESALERALAVVLEHHDVFRLRYREVEGKWRQSHAAVGWGEPGEPQQDMHSCPRGAWLRKTIPFHVETLSGFGDELKQRADYWQASLNLEQGPLTRLVLFRTEDDVRLLWVIHHLIVDGVSWRILLEDLLIAYNEIKAGQTPRLPAKTSSFKAWSERLQAWRDSAGFVEEATRWRQLPPSSAPFPMDHPEGTNQVADACHYTLTFDADTTRRLLIESPSAYRTGIDDLLLSALVLALRDWTGQRKHIIDRESHGRADLFDDMDISRTVGWFTSIYSAVLSLPEGDDLGKIIKTIKEQLRGIPHEGIGYGLLRQQGEELPQGQILFNYLGQFDRGTQTDDFQPAGEGAGRGHTLTGTREHPIEINGATIQNRLSLTFSYSGKQYKDSTIQTLAKGYRDHLQALIGHCREHYGYTPSDFPLAALEQERLDSLTETYGDNIAAIYPLTPMQQGILFHTLYDPESGQYFQQFYYRLQGDVDVRMLRKAWQVLVDRHPILRTAFRHDQGEPVQIVCRQVELPWTQYDWQKLAAEERERRRDELLEQERRQGFDFASPPLMRFQLIRETPDTWQVLWHHHHILLDGWSIPILFGELVIVYAALRQGEIPRLPSVNRYQNYIAWLVQQDQQAARDYWREKLAGFGTPTPIPIIQQRERQSPDYHETELTLSSEQTHDLNRFAREQRVTLNTLVQVAWAILLGRYSGEDDVVFGVNTSGRNVPIPGIETMMGLFINSLPLRVRLKGALPTLLHAIQSQQQQDNQYAYTSLADIQRWSDIPGGMALFDSIIVFENYPMGDTRKNQENLNFQTTDFQSIEYTNYPITLAVISRESLVFKLTFDQNRIAPDAIDRLFGQLGVLFDAMVHDPETDVRRFPILTEAERRRILVEWNATQAPYPHDKCVHELFEEQVAKTPDVVAVIFEEEEVSYGELNARANRLAHRLRKLGVGPEMLVGLFIERSVEMVVGLLAILKAGGAYVPLDPEYPIERLAFMAGDADLKVLLCHGATREKLPECAAHILDMDAENAAIAGESSDNPAPLSEGNNLAYVIYTSGSTGKPKGVCVEHRNIIRLFRTTEDTYHFGSHDVWTLFHSHAFDFSVWEIWGALFYGGTLIVVPYMTTRTPELFYELLIEKGVTVLNQTPSAFYQLIQHEETLSPDTTKSLALRWVIFGGEALNPTKLEPWFRRHGDTVPVLVNMYGITETTVHVTWHLLKSGEAGDAASNIGVPIPDLRAYILDSWQQPVPIGIAGELYVGGAGVARGYLNRPDLTAERFIPDPFSEDPDARLYRTGDLCRWLPDGNMAKGNIAKGNIEYLGRVDTQVKIRGFRIECGEVENALLSHLDVREAVVDARGEGTDKQLVAWLRIENAASKSGAPSGQPARDDLRAHLRALLPEWMIPARFVFVDALPLTPSGKIDRNALPAPEHKDLISGEYIAPRSSIEKTVAGIWRELLGIEQVGVHDNFFDLGGHSLLIIRLQPRLQEIFEKEIPISKLFEYPTVHTLTRYFDREAAQEITRTRAEERHARRASVGKQRQARKKHRSEDS